MKSDAGLAPMISAAGTAVQARGAHTPVADASAGVERDDDGAGRRLVELTEDRIDEAPLPLARLQLEHPRFERRHPLTFLLEQRPQQDHDERDRETLGNEQQARGQRGSVDDAGGQQRRKGRDQRRRGAPQCRADGDRRREEPELRLVGGDTEGPPHDEGRTNGAKTDPVRSKPPPLVRVQRANSAGDPGKRISHRCTTEGLGDWRVTEGSTIGQSRTARV